MRKLTGAVVLSLATGLTVLPGGARAQAPTTSAYAARPRAHTALSGAIEAHEHGDYDRAALLLQQAQAGSAELNEAEQHDLATYQQRNAAAIQARNEASGQLGLAEKAQAGGKTQEAAELLRKVGARRDYLTAADQQKFAQLSERIWPRSAGEATAGSRPALARSKVQQARAQLNQGNFAAADQLAREAENLNVTFSSSEDSPRKVRDDVAKLRQDPKFLLTAGRAAYDRNDLEHAGQLAEMADKASSFFTFPAWSDTPGKLRKDVQAARAKAPAGAAGQPAINTASLETTGLTAHEILRTSATETTIAQPKNDTEALQMMKQARKALAAHNLDQAERISKQVQALHFQVQWWEEQYRPETVLGDVSRARLMVVQTPTPEPLPTPKAPPRTDTAAPKTTTANAQTAPQPEIWQDPRDLLKEGRKKLDAGQFDEACRLAQRAKEAGHGMRWGVFNDNPDALLKDVDEARKDHDREEAARLLAEGRKCYQRGDYGQARSLAYKSMALRNEFGVLDLCDKPQKLLADIDKAEEKSHVTKVPEVPTPGNTTVKSPYSDRTDPSRATAGSQMRLPPDVTNNGKPAPLFPSQMGQQGVTTQAVKPANPGDAKQVARSLVGEARMLASQNRLVEARQKIQVAKETGAQFSALEDDSPANAEVQLNMAAYRRVNLLLDQAEDCARSGMGNATRMQQADDDLAQARQLALAFKFDTSTIDQKAAWLTQFRTGTPVAGSSVPSTPGQTLLTQARKELRCGSYATARKLANEAYQNHPDCRAQAENFLRSLDQEELNQHRLEICRTFDAAERAYREGNYPFAYQILAHVDTKMLDDSRQARLKDLMDSPQMQPTRLVQVKGPDGITIPSPADVPPGTGVASVTDRTPAAPETTFLHQTEAMQNIAFQKLRVEANDVQKRAVQLFQAGNVDQALEELSNFEDERLLKSNLPPEQVALVRRQIEDRIQKFRTVKAQMDFNHERDEQQHAGKKIHDAHELASKNRQQKVAELMGQYQELMENHKYLEAEQKAQLAVDLDPDNAAVIAALRVAQVQHRLQVTDKIKHDNANAWNNEFDHVFQNPNVNSGLDDGVLVNKEFVQRNQKRPDFTHGLTLGQKTDKEKEIESKLLKPQSVAFTDMPLRKVLDNLHALNDINIFLDESALSDAGISANQPITTPPLEGISLKSVLDLILGQMHLTYVPQNEVLFITTEARAHGKLVKKVYQVADLIVPVPDAGLPPDADHVLLGNGNNTPANGSTPPQNAPPTPYIGPFGMQGGSPVGTSTGGNFTTTMGGHGRTIEGQLIQLITRTISPNSWRDVGGPGSIDYYPLGMALIVNQTPDIQEQIQDLLASLRRLQDLEVAVEVRFITIAEGFYERIGVNFNMNIKTDRNTSRFEPTLTSGQFKPAGFVQDFSPKGFIAGLQPTGAFTTDLDIPISTNSFAAAAPPGFGLGQGAFPNGGLDIGLAFLSDIQVFLFLEAVQDDQRTNVMQAPKLVMQDGQTATINVSSTQNFVTNVSANQLPNGAVNFVPVVTNFGTGSVSLTLQPVVSADRRFVRISMSPTLSNLASATIPLFPVVVTIPQTFEGGITAPGPPVLFTQFIQQPNINTINVSTTVTVPDGGTVLLGGLKRMAEGRNEAGPPVLSKIPYIDRLFRNVGYNREAESLMIMVTPRIIITEEEEERQTGLTRQEVGGR